MIPISSVRLDTAVETAVLEVLRSGVIAQGPMVARLEAEFSEMIGVDHTVAVNNGTTALIAALQVLDLGPGDEVITSPFTFVATLNAILQSGATARFADIRSDDFALDPSSVEALIGERTKVIMPVHLYGQVADMDSLQRLAVTEGLEIVEDAAQAHGASLHGRCAGTWGIGCFSLYATKNLTSGEGGLITTNDTERAERLRVLRNQGMRQRYQYEMAGNNYRMTDLQAAVCVPQLSSYAENVERRRANAEALSEGLSGLPWVQVPRALEGRGHVWHQYTILLDDDAPISRDDLIRHLDSRGVGTGVYYPRLVQDYDCYRLDPRVGDDHVPTAASVVRRCLSLPVHPHLTQGDLETIVTAVREAVN